MAIKMILATDLNDGLGKENKLLYSIPQDMEWFKLQTANLPVVMGRKTHESIGRLLPGRNNIILTRDKDYHVAGATVINDITPLLNASNEKDFMVIGGEDIYRLFLPYAETIYHTRISAGREADATFKIDYTGWERTFSFKPVVDAKYPDIEFQIWERDHCSQF
tara:strand:- start:615 stop:1106 length:492 start_codon:yes stop_codon:yes gene_type:complete